MHIWKRQIPKADLTIDSGFPLFDLEEAREAAFSYPYSASPVPAFGRERLGQAANKKNSGDKQLLDVLLDDPFLARLYWAFAHLDRKPDQPCSNSWTREIVSAFCCVGFLWKSYQHSLSHVMVPGGAAAEQAWKDWSALAPNLRRVCGSSDGERQGWMAAYFDALSPDQTEPAVIFHRQSSPKAFYDACAPRAAQKLRRGFSTRLGLLVLVAQLQLDAKNDHRSQTWTPGKAFFPKN